MMGLLAALLAGGGVRPDDLPSDLSWLDRVGTDHPGASVFVRHRDRFSEIFVVRVVDNFLAYLAELLALLFTSRPETLRASETKVPVELVLDHPTRDGLIATLAERRVHELSYKSMRDLSNYMSDKLGFALFESIRATNSAIWLIEVRNVIAHNRGLVNSTFLDRTARSDIDARMKIGDRVAPTFELLELTANAFEQVVANIDRRAIEKWSLPSAAGDA